MKITSLTQLYGFLRTVPKCEQLRVNTEAVKCIEEFGSCYIDEDTFKVELF